MGEGYWRGATFYVCYREMLDSTGKGSAWSKNTNPLNMFYNPKRKSLDSLEKQTAANIKVLVYSLGSASPGQWGWGKKQEGTKDTKPCSDAWQDWPLPCDEPWEAQRGTLSVCPFGMWGYEERNGVQGETIPSYSLGRAEEREYIFPVTSHCLDLVGQSSSHWKLTSSQVQGTSSDLPNY